MYLIFMLLVANIFSHQVMYASQEYKILGDQKESFCSNSLKKIIVYAVEIPKYDTQNGFFLGRQKRWLLPDEYEKVVKIINGNINESTEFPIQLTNFFYNDVEIVDALRWIPAHQKEDIQKRAAYNKRMKAEEDERNACEERKLSQPALRNVTSSLFSFRSSKK